MQPNYYSHDIVLPYGIATCLLRSSCNGTSSGSTPSSNNNRSKGKGNNKNTKNRVWTPPKGGSGSGSNTSSRSLLDVGPRIYYNPVTNT
jgi:hypothetical protein